MLSLSVLWVHPGLNPMETTGATLSSGKSSRGGEGSRSPYAAWQANDNEAFPASGRLCWCAVRCGGKKLRVLLAASGLKRRKKSKQKKAHSQESRRQMAFPSFVCSRCFRRALRNLFLIALVFGMDTISGVCTCGEEVGGKSE